MDQSIDQQSNQTINNQSINRQSINGSINPSIDQQSINQSMDQSINQTINNQSTNNQSIDQYHKWLFHAIEQLINVTTVTRAAQLIRKFFISQSVVLQPIQTIASFLLPNLSVNSNCEHPPHLTPVPLRIGGHLTRETALGKMLARGWKLKNFVISRCVHSQAALLKQLHKRAVVLQRAAVGIVEPSCAKWHIRAAPISVSLTLGHTAANCSESYSRGLVYW